jgi:hypothetical protein
MKAARRSLFALFCLGMLVWFPSEMIHASWHVWTDQVANASSVALMVWCIIFLKQEPNWARAGLVLLLLIFFGPLPIHGI